VRLARRGGAAEEDAGVAQCWFVSTREVASPGALPHSTRGFPPPFNSHKKSLRNYGRHNILLDMFLGVCWQHTHQLVAQPKVCVCGNVLALPKLTKLCPQCIQSLTEASFLLSLKPSNGRQFGAQTQKHHLHLAYIDE